MLNFDFDGGDPFAAPEPSESAAPAESAEPQTLTDLELEVIHDPSIEFGAPDADEAPARDGNEWIAEAHQKILSQRDQQWAEYVRQSQEQKSKDEIVAGKLLDEMGRIMDMPPEDSWDYFD